METEDMCKLCFVEHGVTKTASYVCMLNLNYKIIKLCKRCASKNKIVIAKYRKIGTENWFTMTEHTVIL